MIGFLLRKSLYDFWDNMLRIVLINMGFLLVTAIPVFLPILVSRFLIESFIVEVVLTGIGILACSIYLAAAGFSLKSISDYGNFGFGDFFYNIKKSWKCGLVIGVFVFLLFLVVTIILPFYFGMGSIIGLALAALVFWLTIFAISSFQYYLSATVRLGAPTGGEIFKSLRKCMLISFDNTAFTLFLFIHNLIVILLPFMFPFFIFILIMPGPAGILLYLDEALRLRLFKYDWLESHPESNRKKIPWEELLVEEREKVGHRTIRNFIFPWKD